VKGALIRGRMQRGVGGKGDLDLRTDLHGEFLNTLFSFQGPMDLEKK